MHIMYLGKILKISYLHQHGNDGKLYILYTKLMSFKKSIHDVHCPGCTCQLVLCLDLFFVSSKQG